MKSNTKSLKKANKSSSTKSAKKTKKIRSATKQPAVHEKQWIMPASFCADGTTLATLKDVVDPQTPTLSLSELTPEQRADLVVKRIEAQKDFELAMLGAGLVNKERAIAEVRAQSKVGRVLMQIEQRMISNLIEKAQKKGA